MSASDLPPQVDSIRCELDPEESLLWCDVPDSRHHMTPTIPLVIFSLGWNAFMINFIYIWNRGTSDAEGPAGLFGMNGILANMFFIPFIAVGLGSLFAPFWMWRSAKHTVYGITNRRVIIVSKLWKTKVRSFWPKDVSEIQRTNRSDGTGDLLIGRELSSPSQSDGNEVSFRLDGVKNVREVEKILRQMIETSWKGT